MGETQAMLFGPPAANTPPRTGANRAPTAIPDSPTRRVGAEHIRPQAPKLCARVLSVLERAGPVSADGQLGGSTIQELAGIVSEWRGQLVRETTICGRLGELRKAGLVADSGHTRMGNAGVAVRVFVHWDHVKPTEGARG